MRGLSASYASGEEAAAWNASSPAATLLTADALLRPAGAANSPCTRHRVAPAARARHAANPSAAKAVARRKGTRL